MGSIKDRNGTDLTEAEDIKNRWQEYIELYKKDLNDLDNHDGMITHIEPSQLGLRKLVMNKASEVMEFQLSYFKS